MSDNRDELVSALARHRDHQFAEFLTFAIGLAAESHPENLRAALGKVFSIECIEETTKRLMLVVSQAQASANEARLLLQTLHEKLEAADRRIDQLQFALEQHERPHANAAARPLRRPQ